jgi:hypothetical protein
MKRVLMQPLYAWSALCSMIYHALHWQGDIEHYDDGHTMSFWEYAIEEIWELREDFFLLWTEYNLRRFRCWLFRHDIHGARIAPVYGAPMEYWCEKCWMHDPVNYPEWGLASYLNRMYRWWCDHVTWWYEVDAWIFRHRKLRRLLPFWWEY